MSLRKGETQLINFDGHHDIRNDGDSCFGHPGITWCETCKAVLGTESWKNSCQNKCVNCGDMEPPIWQNGQWSCPECFYKKEAS